MLRLFHFCIITGVYNVLNVGGTIISKWPANTLLTIILMPSSALRCYLGAVYNSYQSVISATCPDSTYTYCVSLCLSTQMTFGCVTNYGLASLNAQYAGVVSCSSDNCNTQTQSRCTSATLNLISTAPSSTGIAFFKFFEVYTAFVWFSFLWMQFQLIVLTFIFCLTLHPTVQIDFKTNSFHAKVFTATLVVPQLSS